MLRSGERVQTPSSLARLRAATRSTFRLLCDEVLVGSPELARIGLIALALGLQTTALYSPGHFRPAPNGFFAVLVAAVIFGSLALSFVATLEIKPLIGLRLRQLLAAGALVVLATLSIIGVREGVQGGWSISHGLPYTNDGAVMDLHSAQLLLHGQSPYVKTNIIPALADINAPCRTVTPLMEGQFRGARAYPSDAAITQACLNDLHYRARPGVPVPAEFESKYNYPAGSALVILPFVWAGMQDMRVLYALAALGMGAYLWSRLPRLFRLLVPLLLLGDVPIITHNIGGQPDTIYGLMLLIGYAEWRRSRISPIAMGLAAATKQLVWFFLPFYLLIVVKHFGWREAARRSGLMALVFLAVNGLFIVQSPAGYLASVLAPMNDPMFPVGVGIIALFVSSTLPMLPKLAFTLAQLGSWAGSVAAFARLRILPVASTVVLATLPLFFAWRSLITYFYLAPLLALAVAIADRGTRPAESTAT